MEKTVLPNGVRIVTERMEGVRSAALGIFVGVGSRCEKKSESGAAHFLEHLTFKGTQTRTAEQLAVEMDDVGGEVNAYTTKEGTCFYARVLDRHLDRATDVLCDMFFHSVCAEESVRTERGVILEEIRMYRDNPEDLCAEKLAGAVFAPSPLAMPIEGRASTLNRMTGAWLLGYKRRQYVPDRVVVSLAGSFPDSAVQELCSRFGQMPAGQGRPVERASYRPAFVRTRKTTEQNHFLLGFPGLASGDPRRYADNLLSTALGGGMSSRLFQKVREQTGLCYSVYACPERYADTGCAEIYTAVSPETEEEALRRIVQEIRDVTENGITQEELDRARVQTVSSILLGTESVQARMSWMGREELLLGSVTPLRETLARYESVTRDDVLEAARAQYDFSKISLSCVGKVRDEETYRRILSAPC